MGGFAGGILQGLNEGFKKTQEDIRQEEARKDEQEHATLMALLRADDPEVQKLALATLLQGPKKGKKAGGIRGWLGETEKTPHYQQLQDLDGALGKSQPGAPPPTESFGGPPASQVSTGAQVDREVGAPPPQPEPAVSTTPNMPRLAGLVGAPEAPQVMPQPQGPVAAAPMPGAPPPSAAAVSSPGMPPPPAPDPFRFEGREVLPETPDEEILGPPPTFPKGFVNIPSEVRAQYTQATAAYNARGKALQAERDAYRKEQHAVVTRHYEAVQKQAEQDKRDADTRKFQLERDRIRDDRLDARERLRDAATERRARAARGEADKASDVKDHRRAVQHENDLYSREVTTLKSHFIDPAEIEAAKVEHEKTLRMIADSFRVTAGVAVPKDLGKGKAPAQGKYKVTIVGE